MFVWTPAEVQLCSSLVDVIAQQYDMREITSCILGFG